MGLTSFSGELADENGVSIKVAKYAGTTKVDLVENEEYGYCSLIKATNHVLEKMKIENVTKAKVTSTKRIEKNLVESVPLREALINSIVHNDFSREIPPVFEIFSNRIEFNIIWWFDFQAKYRRFFQL